MVRPQACCQTAPEVIRKSFPAGSLSRAAASKTHAANSEAPAKASGEIDRLIGLLDASDEYVMVRGGGSRDHRRSRTESAHRRTA